MNEIDYLTFRQDIREFLEENLTHSMRQAGRLQTYAFPHMEQALEWQKVRNIHGYGAPNWPKEFGGTGWDVRQQEIFHEECLAAGAPGIHQQSLNMCGPCLIGHGSKAQQDYYLPRILSAEHVWCQGYSEPESGSDLASIKTSAERDGDQYIVSGTKIWTSNAHDATHMFCLVRTSSEGRPQQGISFLLIDMKSPGISVKPIKNLNGVHEQNHVYLDNVRVPQSNRVGGENEGWKVAKYLLEFERGGTSIVPMLRRNLAMVMTALDEAAAPGAADQLDQANFRRMLAAKEMSALAVQATELRLNSKRGQTGSPGAFSSMTRVISRELLQDIDELLVETAGPYVMAFQPEAMRPGFDGKVIGPDYAHTAVPRYFDQRAATIAGGTSEVQRNIIAKAFLGL